VKTKLWIVILALACGMLAAGRLEAQRSSFNTGHSSARASSAAEGQLASLLREPLPNNIAWSTPAAVYNSDSLYQYIDGGADIYLLYDFKALLHQGFKSGSTDLTADIYEMSTPEDAFGIYASERSPAYKFIAIGAEGYRDKGILNFFADRYYVKLSGSGANADWLLGHFAGLLSGRITGVRTLPPLLERLPRAHRVPHSEQYVKKDPLGHAFLSPAYVVTYADGKQQSKLVVSVANDARGATSRAEQLAMHFKQSGKSVSAPELGESGMRGENSFEGTVIARTHGRYLIALFNSAGSGSADILTKTAKGLP